MHPHVDARKRAIEEAMKIDGWLTAREAGVLFDLAESSAGPIVEIGSFRGRSTVALALGSMAGTGETVNAIDSFVGAKPDDRPTNKGVPVLSSTCSESILRENLVSAGVNGTVRILPMTSAQAVKMIPEKIGVLFIDGGHDYPSVNEDMNLYLPRLMTGGRLMVHDVLETDMGVVRAVDEHLLAHPERWTLRGRVDSAILAESGQSVRRRVALGFPGPTLCFGAAKGIMQASLGAHEVVLLNSGTGWDDFNTVWTNALNLFEKGEVTHFAMLHSDIIPDPGWLDILINEMERIHADLVSAVSPIKDVRGLTSCGIGDLSDTWLPYRRFTMREIVEYPETFCITDTLYPDKFLLHNTACWTCDLRNPIFFETDKSGCLKCFFNFPRRAFRGPDGLWTTACESEDWFFSRQIYMLGAKTFITRKVRLYHKGSTDFPNDRPWGTYEHGDEDTRARWDKKPAQPITERT